MMRRIIVAAVSLALLFPVAAGAYEAEDAVPLTVAAALGQLGIERLAIRLNGRGVEIDTSVRNAEASAQVVGFYAYTPFFRQLGDGEEHADKTFSDLTMARAGSAARRPAGLRRGFFMGQDITAALAKAGIGPLPDRNVSDKALAKVRLPLAFKPDEWDGYVAYSWSETVAPHSSSTSTIHYRALPQFTLDNFSTDSFRQAVLQHCGDPARIARAFAPADNPSAEVLVERYEVPVAFMKMQEVSLQVTQPATNWLGAHPFLTLVCGMPNGDSKASLSGTLANANKVISVLVISHLAQAGEKKGNTHGQ